MMTARQPKQGYKEAIEAIDDAVKNMSEEVSQSNKSASSWDYGTYHIGDQRRLRPGKPAHLWSLVRAFAVRTLEVWKKSLEDEGSNQKSDI